MPISILNRLTLNIISKEWNWSFLVLLIWILLRLIEFITGYVEYSHLRFFLAISLGFLLILNWLPFEFNQKEKINKFEKSWNVILILICSVIGYILFLTRYVRGANMGETFIFKESIENTAIYGGWLWNKYEGVSHFAYHNSPGLFLFVPIIWFLGKYGWFLISFIQSLAIVLANYFSSIKIMNGKWKTNIAVLFFLTLFLSMYTQHAKFIDTRFGMLGLSIFIIGILEKNKKLNIAGFIICLLFRETIIIPCLMITIFTRPYPFSKTIKWSIIVSSILWSILTIIIVNNLNPDGISGNGFTSLGIGIFDNIELKIPHLLRMFSLGPLIFWSVPGLIGLASEISILLFASHQKFYSLSWHLWIIPSTIIIIYSLDVLKRRYYKSLKIVNQYFKFVILTFMWQFLTTFHPRLF